MVGFRACFSALMLYANSATLCALVCWFGCSLRCDITRLRVARAARGFFSTGQHAADSVCIAYGGSLAACLARSGVLSAPAARCRALRGGSSAADIVAPSRAHLPRFFSIINGICYLVFGRNMVTAFYRQVLHSLCSTPSSAINSAVVTRIRRPGVHGNERARAGLIACNAEP
jgi:hypothetical protein